MVKALILPKRVRNELCFRSLQVIDKQAITKKFWRVTFEHEDLVGFNSAGFDDHIKVFFPNDVNQNLKKPSVGEDGILWPDGQQPLNRDYTPLDFDGRSRLVLDFFRHHGGVASEWAETAKVGQMLVMGGPRGSLIVPNNYSTQVYLCDETGLPALSRRLSQIDGKDVALFIFADSQVVTEYLPNIPTQFQLNVFSPNLMLDQDFTQVFQQLAAIEMPKNDTFCWLTGEGKAVKILNDYLIEHRQCQNELIRSVAYWHKR